MMICPETFYEIRLKGKTPEQIMSAIRGLKQEIGRLKNIVEHPNYELRSMVVHPTEKVQLSMNREYLERAKQAFVEAGGIYKPSAAEQKALDFDNSIPYINKIEFSIGGFFGGYETKTYTVDEDKVHIDVEHSLILKPSNIGDAKTEEIDKQEFLEAFKDLRIGEWRKKYDTYRFNIAVMDGTQWHLEIYFSNGHRPVKIHGDNAYPYNFNRLLELFEIENEDIGE
jgi:hypothetical protein